MTINIPDPQQYAPYYIAAGVVVEYTIAMILFRVFWKKESNTDEQTPRMLCWLVHPLYVPFALVGIGLYLGWNVIAIISFGFVDPCWDTDEWLS